MSVTKAEYSASHFPNVDPQFKPCGAQILVQLRTVKKKVGSIILVDDTKEFNKQNTRVCKLVAIGSIAFRNRDTGQLWKEGVWAEEGDIVLMPAWGGFRFEIPIPDSDDTAIFAVFKDFDIAGTLLGNFEAFDQLL